jgi:hypothetical protein
MHITPDKIKQVLGIGYSDLFKDHIMVCLTKEGYEIKFWASSVYNGENEDGYTFSEDMKDFIDIHIMMEEL